MFVNSLIKPTTTNNSLRRSQTLYYVHHNLHHFSGKFPQRVVCRPILEETRIGLRDKITTRLFLTNREQN